MSKLDSLAVAALTAGVPVWSHVGNKLAADELADGGTGAEAVKLAVAAINHLPEYVIPERGGDGFIAATRKHLLTSSDAISVLAGVATTLDIMY